MNESCAPLLLGFFPPSCQLIEEFTKEEDDAHSPGRAHRWVLRTSVIVHDIIVVNTAFDVRGRATNDLLLR